MQKAPPPKRWFELTDLKVRAPVKSGGRSAVPAKNLAAGVAIPAAELVNDDGATVPRQAAFFKSAAIRSIRTRNKDGDPDHVHLNLYFNLHTV
jgi:hypothetical protein